MLATIPDAPARAYLLVIEGNPQGVAVLLQASPLARSLGAISPQKSTR